MSRSVRTVLVLIVASPLFAFAILLAVNSGVLGFGGPVPEPPGAKLTAGGETRTGVGTVGCWREKQVWLPDLKVCISSEAGAVDSSGRQVEAYRAGGVDVLRVRGRVRA